MIGSEDLARGGRRDDGRSGAREVRTLARRAVGTFGLRDLVRLERSDGGTRRGSDLGTSREATFGIFGLGSLGPSFQRSDRGGSRVSAGFPGVFEQTRGGAVERGGAGGRLRPSRPIAIAIAPAWRTGPRSHLVGTLV